MLTSAQFPGLRSEASDWHTGTFIFVPMEFCRGAVLGLAKCDVAHVANVIFAHLKYLCASESKDSGRQEQTDLDFVRFPPFLMTLVARILVGRVLSRSLQFLYPFTN